MKRHVLIPVLVLMAMTLAFNVALLTVPIPESAAATQYARTKAVQELKAELGRVRRMAAWQKRQLEARFIEETRIRAKLERIEANQSRLLKLLTHHATRTQ